MPTGGAKPARILQETSLEPEFVNVKGR
jgi:hypothetical protein